MTLDKSIKHGKEHRKPYHGAKAIDPSCRNHGSDDWAKDDRTIRAMKEETKMEIREQDDILEEVDDAGRDE